MSELQVDTIKPSLSTQVTITPSVVVENIQSVAKFEVTASGETKILGPLNVGTTVSNTPGSEYQVLTSQGSGLPPVWGPTVPIGGIIMWYGSVSTIPTGWALCNGVTVKGFKTPDLRDRFVVGAGNSYSVGVTGGSPDAVVVSHTHTITPNPHNHGSSNHAHTRGCEVDCDDDGQFVWPPNGTVVGGAVTLSLSTEGVSGVGKNLPPYYALCYIMRVPTS